MVNEIGKIHKTLKEQLIDLNVLIEECQRELPTPIIVRGADGERYGITEILRNAAFNLEEATLELESAQLLFHK